MSQPKILKALDGHIGTDRMTDENLKTLHLYLYVALLQCDHQMRKRGMGEGEEVFMRVIKPQ